MRGRKLKRFSLVLCVMLSLLASPVAACACSHHETAAVVDEAVESSTSCHSSPSAEETKSETARQTQSDEINQSDFSSGDCFCIESAAPEFFSKSETVKVEKQIIAFIATPQFVKIQAIKIVSASNFTPPFYLSDSFYNLTPGRAPPARL